MTARPRWSVTKQPGGLSAHDRLVRDVREGLSADPPRIPARWFYDEKGSLLFDEITSLDEYYPTRCEHEILATHSSDVVAITAATALVELGSGTSTKTRLLLDAFTAQGRELLFAPLDISSEILIVAAREVAEHYSSVTVEAVVADFEDPLGPLPGRPGERLIAFFGSTIGNLNAAARAAFLAQVRAALCPGDHFLVGADLVKSESRLVAAYDDSEGVTAAFNRNVIEVLARELSAEHLSPDDFDHVARWNERESQIEMWLRARREIRASFPELQMKWEIAAGSELLTEISVKFEIGQIADELGGQQFTVIESWNDRAGDFSVTLARAV